VARIERHTIDADVAVEAVALHLLLGAVVATLAQRLERAELEKSSVSSVRRDVINHDSDLVAISRVERVMRMHQCAARGRA
jgi:hypothetical protein